MMLKWFKRMFLEILLDEEVRQEIIEATEYQTQRRLLPKPSPPKFARYIRPTTNR